MKQGIFKAAAVLAVLFTSSIAYAGVSGPVLNFEGSDCSVDCIEGASASLTFNEGYQLGDPFGVEDLEFFTFSSDSPVFTGFQLAFFLDAEGSLAGTPNELADVFIRGVATVVGSNFEPDELQPEVLFDGFIGFEFTTSSNPEDDWSMTAFTFFDDNFLTADDIGGTGIWSPTRITQAPEPGMLALFGVGLIGLALVRRRRKLAA